RGLDADARDAIELGGRGDLRGLGLGALALGAGACADDLGAGALEHLLCALELARGGLRRTRRRLAPCGVGALARDALGLARCHLRRLGGRLALLLIGLELPCSLELRLRGEPRRLGLGARPRGLALGERGLLAQAPELLLALGVTGRRL